MDRAIGWIAGTNGSDTEINGKLNSLELPYTMYTSLNIKDEGLNKTTEQVNCTPYVI